MAWVVDTCVLIDVLDDDSAFGEIAADKLDAYRESGLVVCPVTLIEMGPAFCGDWGKMEDFFNLLTISRPEWTLNHSKKSFAAWDRAVELKRSQRAGKRPVADVMIGAFSLEFEGLITRNASDFTSLFPKLDIVEVDK